MYRFQFALAGGGQHQADWQQLRAVRGGLATVHSPFSSAAQGGELNLWCRVVGTDDRLYAGAVIAVARSRKLPLVRVGRISFATELVRVVGTAGLTELIAALAHHPGSPSLLSLHVYSVLEEELRELEAMALGAGFQPEQPPRTFHDTLLVPILRPLEEQLKQMTYAARRGIRQVTERGFVVAPLSDTTHVERVSWLNAEAHRRTGGRSREVDFASAIDQSQKDPEGSVVFGIFHPLRPLHTALVGFAHGVSSGSSIVYASAGTERAEDIGSAPLSYGLVAALLRWTAERGFDVFDFGGVTPIEAVNHPLAGISEFKRKFRGKDARVASDYTIAVRPIGAALLRALEKPARFVGRGG